MKTPLTAALLMLGMYCQAQIGIGTTSPNSTLDVRGSLSTRYSSFSSNTTAGSTDNTLVFTGTSATTLTLPDATACQGRTYWVKSTSSNASVLTIATTAAQTIDGLASWSLAQQYKVVAITSNGSNWIVASESLPGTSAGTPWIYGGNNVASTQNIGTTSNYDLPFITNNTEKMRLDVGGRLGLGLTTPSYLLHVRAAAGSGNLSIARFEGTQSAGGNVQFQLVNNSSSNSKTFFSFGGSTVSKQWALGNDLMGNNAQDFYIFDFNALTTRFYINNQGSTAIGSILFNATYPEKLLVDAGATGNTNYQNVIVGKGNTNSYAQLNIQNFNAGTAASSDVVATSDNGNETANFVDMGINGSGNTSTGVIGGANTAYLYSTGNDFAIGNGSNSRNLNFFTTASSTYTERMRITSAGNVGIANTSPAERLDITGNLRFSGALMPGGSAGTAGTFLVSAGAGIAPVWFDASAYAWLIDGNGVTSERRFGTTSAYALPFITNNAERMRITATGDVGIGTSTFNATYPEQLLVDAGSTGNTNYQNVIVGKGNTNSYAQLNIQNNSTGTAASSDVVATANNGSESVNYVDMGINGGGNTSTGVLGGANTAYLYSTGNDFAIGNGSNTRNLNFFTTTSGTYTERMRITASGDVGIGSSTFNATYPEQLLVDAGATGNTNYQNVIVGKGNTNSYAQLNIQNYSAGTSASSDVVATANNGNESINYIDMGINGGSNTSGGVIGGANTAYLYSTGNDFAIGNGTNSRDLVFFTTTGGTYTERMRISSAGHLVPSANNTYNLGSATNRWGTIYSQNVLNVSDARLKTNISDLRYGLKEVLNLHPVQYNWKEGDDKENKLGFLAQELRSVIPEVVKGDEGKETLAVNYIELIPVLVKAIKEQQKQIDELNRKLEANKK